MEISKKRFMTRYGLKLLSSVSVIVYDWFLCNIIPWYPQRKSTDVDLFPSLIYDGGTPKLCVSRAASARSEIRVK